MKIRIIIGFFLLFPYLGFSQGEFNNWCFGYNAGLTFNSGPPVVLPGVNMNCFGTGSSTVSDSLGNLLFYTNDMSINNRNNVLMPNGNIGLNGCGSGYVKNSVAFRQLNDLTKYFIFSGGCGSATNLSGLRYTVVDMTLDGGLGDVVNGLGNVPVPGASNAHWAVTGTRHNNNRDIWVVVRTRETGSNYYLSYLVNPSGINFTPVQSNSHIQLYTVPATSPVVRNIKISRDGTKMVAIYDTIMEFCSFNPTTGQVTPMFLAYLPLCGTRHVIPKSAEFSVKGKYLYVSGARNSNCGAQFGFLFQFDASKTDSVQFQNSAIQIMNEPTPPGLQLAPDGKIYCTTNGLDSLSAINNPSSQGIGCNYQRDVIGLQGSQSANALPDYIERYYAMIHATGLCPGEIASFSSTVWPPADSIHWDFGDLASGGSNFSNLPNPTHIYNTNGTYTVEMFVRHIDNRTDIIWKTISIVPGQQVNLGADRTVCTGDSTTFDAGVCTGCTYLWKKLPAGITVGTSRTFRTNQVGNYTAIVTNSNGCIGSDTVQLSNTSMPVVTNNPLSKSICSGQYTNISLTSNLPGTTFHWTATLTSGNVTGFSADSGLVINQILTNTFPVAGIVTYHITPKIASCSGNMVDFPVTVNPGDSVKVTITSSGNPVCAGTQVTFTATPSFGGTTPSYQWKVNGINKGTNNSVYTYTPNNGDVVKCILTSSFTQCVTNNPATSNTIQMVVNPNLPVSVSVSPSANPVCDGTSVTFTATPIHGGTTPSFQWKVNGINAGTNSSS
ncbi:MAG: PKD domain-containing protein, partial [Bacteroidota bacterium]